MATVPSILELNDDCLHLVCRAVYQLPPRGRYARGHGDQRRRQATHLEQFGGTCKRLNKLATPIIFSRLRIVLPLENTLAALTQLNHLPQLIRFVRYGSRSRVRQRPLAYKWAYLSEISFELEIRACVAVAPFAVSLGELLTSLSHQLTALTFLISSTGDASLNHLAEFQRAFDPRPICFPGVRRLMADDLTWRLLLPTCPNVSSLDLQFHWSYRRASVPPIYSAVHRNVRYLRFGGGFDLGQAAGA